MIDSIVVQILRPPPISFRGVGMANGVDKSPAWGILASPANEYKAQFGKNE